MKKIGILFVSVIVSCLSIFAVAGCSTKLKNYKGPQVLKITYSSRDYFGGQTEDYLLDFSSDTANKREYWPSYDWNEDDYPQYEQFADFTESDAKLFLDKCYTYGLFSIKESYEPDHIIDDGGGWSLTIEYADGTTFVSTGNNARPEDVFSECKYAFYDLCGEGVVGIIPDEYIYPLDILLCLDYKIGDGYFEVVGMPHASRGNYRWNGNSVSGTSYYELNQELSANNQFDANIRYTLNCSTQFYNSENKFKKFTLSCYDCNQELSGEQVLISTKWFENKSVPLQFNKIYIYRLYWKNGDFAEYTFNTKI